MGVPKLNSSGSSGQHPDIPGVTTVPTLYGNVYNSQGSNPPQHYRTLGTNQSSKIIETEPGVYKLVPFDYLPSSTNLGQAFYTEEDLKNLHNMNMPDSSPFDAVLGKQSFDEATVKKISSVFDSGKGWFAEAWNSARGMFGLVSEGLKEFGRGAFNADTAFAATARTWGILGIGTYCIIDALMSLDVWRKKKTAKTKNELPPAADLFKVAYCALVGLGFLGPFTGGRNPLATNENGEFSLKTKSLVGGAIGLWAYTRFTNMAKGTSIVNKITGLFGMNIKGLARLPFDMWTALWSDETEKEPANQQGTGATA